MLVSVVARSRPVDQLVEKSDGPKGFDEPRRPGLCGIEPARRRDNAVVLPPLLAVAGLVPESIPETPGGLKGLVDGVGREVLDRKDCWTFTPLSGPTGENREGTVPALALRAVLLIVPSEGGTKSGNPSWLGDSGIFSRRGVELPLVGGPQMLGETPSCAWISRALKIKRIFISQRSHFNSKWAVTYRFEYRRAPRS